MQDMQETGELACAKLTLMLEGGVVLLAWSVHGPGDVTVRRCEGLLREMVPATVIV
jgi:hypothetical protein